MRRFVLHLAMVAALLGGVIAVAMPTPATAGVRSFFCGTPGPSAGLTGPCFVIGDESAEYVGVTPSTVQFWGAQWAQNNSLSGGAAPISFKGFADTVTPSSGFPTGTFVTRTGNSSQPPPTVGSIICVLVADRVTQSGPVISGHFIDIVEVRTDPGYGPDPGHAGTGHVIGNAGSGECQQRL